MDGLFTYWPQIMALYAGIGFAAAVLMMKAIAWSAREQKKREHPMIYVGVFVSAVVYWFPFLCVTVCLLLVVGIAMAVMFIGSDRKDRQ